MSSIIYGVSVPTTNRHHRCNRCGRDFDSGERLDEHVERRHPKEDVRWWVVVEDPAKDRKFSR
ncbi:hypothetical protein C5C07_10720 [Haloferax sp. Atlit-4N]|uniref:hypothetical protein n=1 Tax=Haloferax sp. Atlit-4N TaxID=2077206 RepID=UPI000E253018|nr:hypothetical protein [Haloferax sp. Atlit-4N]RDZ52254.1 hypothetical protein C5C07_10720 [Haloferax sp. Atlit-4N]